MYKPIHNWDILNSSNAYDEWGLRGILQDQANQQMAVRVTSSSGRTNWGVPIL